MAHQSVEASPQIYARTGGLLYLLIIVGGLLVEGFGRGKLIVSGDPAATAQNIIAHEGLFRISIAVELLMAMLAIGTTLIFYLFFRPVNKNLALLAVFLDLVSIALETADKSYLQDALSFLGRADYLKAFTPKQLQVLAYHSLQSHESCLGISLLVFGFSCLVQGYLLFRSGYFPRIIGILMGIAGLCYVINSLALIAAPALADRLFPVILVPSFIGESAFCLCLLIKGVNVAKWNERVDGGGR